MAGWVTAKDVSREEVLKLVSRKMGVPVEQLSDDTQLQGHTLAVLDACLFTFGKSIKVDPGPNFCVRDLIGLLTA